jgi:hypothetical protein
MTITTRLKTAEAASTIITSINRKMSSADYYPYDSAENFFSDEPASAQILRFQLNYGDIHSFVNSVPFQVWCELYFKNTRWVYLIDQ